MTPGQWVDAFLALPGRASAMNSRLEQLAAMAGQLDAIDERTRRIEIMAELTNAALAELDTELGALATELEDIADGVTDADRDTAGEIRERVARVQALRSQVTPETPPTDPDGPTAPTDGGGSVADPDVP